jgi:hypothetical protein
MPEALFPHPTHEAVTVKASVEPVYSALVSLSLLTTDATDLAVDAWVTHTAERLTPEQRRNNRMIFDGLAEAVLPDTTYPDFPAYLDALEKQSPASLRKRVTDEYVNTCVDRRLQRDVRALLEDPRAMQHLIVDHLREQWNSALAVEWERHVRNARGMTSYLNQNLFSQPAWANRTAAEAIRAFTRRDAPDAILSQLADVKRVIFVLSPHVQIYASRFGSEDAIWVFVKFENRMMREAPLKRAEVLGPLSALADDTRLRILELLAANGEMRAQDIIAQIDASQPNVSRHLKQLAGAGFVTERRASGANKWYRLNVTRVAESFSSLKQLLSPENARAALALERDSAIEAKRRADQPDELRIFLDPEGRVSRWPNKRKDQLHILDYIASKFELNREYSEKEINVVLTQWHTFRDPVTLRRELFDSGLLGRTKNGAKYWRAR